MKAFVCKQQDGGSVLIEVALPKPIPKPYEMVVSVRAAGVTPTELLWYPTTHNKDGSPRTSAVPGHEFSGEITAIGERVFGFRVGDEILGMNDWFENGATAEFCLTDEKSSILKPRSISHVEAAASPISALTAWQGLVERAKVKSGDRVLIVGASGSVGLMAVQIARLYGCIVSASASASAAPQLASLGCAEILDHRTQPFDEYLRDIDVVFDAVGADTLARAEKILAPLGRMVTIAADAEGNNDPAIKAAFFIVEPSVPQLQRVVRLLEEGKLHPFVKAVLPFAEAPRAYSGNVNVSGLGKLVLEVGETEAEAVP
jgi:NADPH:quinone reductase-like Zn-dependent oxidoreductase